MARFAIRVRGAAEIAICGLNLGNLELAVLSACDTSLGNVAGGEASYGLQRAFHTAGCRNVVASVWKVEDAATQALMIQFYRNLWRKKQLAILALRASQLAMLRGELDIQMAQLRGPIKQAEIPTRPDRIPLAKPPKSTRDPYYWAAFMLSGSGK